jgi:hypothetical protein
VLGWASQTVPPANQNSPLLLCQALAWDLGFCQFLNPGNQICAMSIHFPLSFNSGQKYDFNVSLGMYLNIPF